MIKPRDYGYRALVAPWDLGTPKANKAKKRRLQLWREDIGEWLTIRSFNTKADALEYADSQGFSEEDFRVL